MPGRSVPGAASTRARWRSSTASASASASRPSPASNAPACRCACAAAKARSARRPRLGGQRDRTLQERRRCRQPGARLGPARRPLELGGDVFVRPGGRRRQVPDPTVGIDLGIGRRRRAPGARRGGPRPTQRRTRPTAPGDGGSAPRSRSRAAVPPRLRGRGSSPTPERLRRPPQQRGVPGGVGRRQSNSCWVGSGSARTRRR